MDKFVWVFLLILHLAPRAGAAPSFGDPKVAPRAARRAAKSALESMLSAYERVPSVKEILRVDPSPDRIVRELIHLARSPAKPSWLRTRAIALLGHFDRADAKKCVRAIAQNRSNRLVIARAAILAIRDQEGTSTVLPFLDHPEPALREAAFYALSRHSTPSIRKRLREAQAAETLPHLAERYARSLRRR